MAVKVCFIVDSNLKDLRIGKGCARIKPYIKCDGRVYCPYVVNNKSRQMPTVKEIQEQEFTDIVIALGMNHCKLGAENQEKALLDLADLFRHFRNSLHQVRLYHVLVPPSLSTRINNNIIRFNKTIQLLLNNVSGLKVIRIPTALYAHTGVLSVAYARLSETVAGFPDGKKLHINQAGQSKLVYNIIRVISRAANKRLMS